MFLKKNYSKTTGRTYLSIAQGYRDSDGKNKHKNIESLGYLDELTEKYDDPIAHFEAVVKEMDKERLENEMVTVTLDLKEDIDPKKVHRKNYGYAVYSKIYHELEIDIFLKNARRHENFKFNTDAIMRLLVYSRLLNPSSKMAAVLEKDRFFENFNFTLDDVYHALTHFDKISEKLQLHLHKQVTEQYNRKTNIVYYDVTNYYFEIDKEDILRKKGFSKEHRKDPIVQMGLLMDNITLPISYKIFPGNTHDSQTLMPILANIKKEYGTERIISVADKGLNSGDNIAFHTALGDGYIYSKSVRGASEEFKKWVLDESGYRNSTENYKLKSKIVPDAIINVTFEQIGKKRKKKQMKVEQKWIVFYSEKYAKRARHKREEAIAKALKIIANPEMYKQTFEYGAIGYIENIKLCKETGEISNIKEKLVLDEQKIADEEKYDGYYAIITSELDDADEHIIKTYRGLWRIEESFKITKSILNARPVYLKTIEHVNAHFLICFISLLIARIVELRLGNKYPVHQIAETLRKVACSHVTQNIWLFDYANEITADIAATLGINIGKKNMTLQAIKKELGATKKRAK